MLINNLPLLINLQESSHSDLTVSTESSSVVGHPFGMVAQDDDIKFQRPNIPSFSISLAHLEFGKVRHHKY